MFVKENPDKKARRKKQSKKSIVQELLSNLFFIKMDIKLMRNTYEGAAALFVNEGRRPIVLWCSWHFSRQSQITNIWAENYITKAYLGPCRTSMMELCAKYASALETFYKSMRTNRLTWQVLRNMSTIFDRTFSKYSEQPGCNYQDVAQPAYTCSKLTKETLEQGVKYVQS